MIFEAEVTTFLNDAPYEETLRGQALMADGIILSPTRNQIVYSNQGRTETSTISAFTAIFSDIYKYRFFIWRYFLRGFKVP